MVNKLETSLSKLHIPPPSRFGYFCRFSFTFKNFHFVRVESCTLSINEAVPLVPLSLPYIRRDSGCCQYLDWQYLFSDCGRIC